jgi:glycosyltransferase involved in cell wall biosynthesis
MLTILHLTASPSFGGPERQMLELGCELRDSCRSVFVTFQEEGRCWDFVRNAQSAGFGAYALKYDSPRLFAAYRELLALAREHKPAILMPHGYKSNLIGLLVARRLGIPIISISNGWTGESLRVRLFEALDRRLLRRMDKVVCVSEGQARKVRQAGVPEGKVKVIRDAVRSERFAEVDGAYRDQLERMFPERPDVIVGAAGRLSPEKGFSVLVDAAAQVLRMKDEGGRMKDEGGRMKDEGGRMKDESLPPSPLAPPPSSSPSVGFVLFGDGPLRPALESQIKARGLENHFLLAGFHSDLDKFYPHLDLLVLPSYTEGLPNVVLEAFAAGVPVVATAVGGTPEAVEDGVDGYLVPPADATALAGRIGAMLSDPARRKEMGARGQDKVRRVFSFAQQAREYRQLIESLLPASVPLRKQDQPASVGTAP